MDLPSSRPTVSRGVYVGTIRGAVTRITVPDRNQNNDAALPGKQAGLSTAQCFQMPAFPIDDQRVAGLIPVTENDSRYLPAIHYKGVNAGPVGVPMD